MIFEVRQVEVAALQLVDLEADMLEAGWLVGVCECEKEGKMGGCEKRLDRGVICQGLYFNVPGLQWPGCRYWPMWGP